MPPDFVYDWSEAGMFLFVLAVTAAVSMIVHLVFKLPAMMRASDSIADLSPVLQALCGTLFVLSVTFLANSVWHTEDRARESVNEEARSIQVMRTYMESMTGPSREGFGKLVKSYGEAVALEWPAMASKGSHPDAEKQLADIYRATLQGFSEGEMNRALQQRILAALDSLSRARQQRLSMSQDAVSGGQWFTVLALALLLIVVIATCHGRFSRARAVALAAVTFAITISLFVILAHDRPFIGRLAVTPAPIAEAVGS